MRDNDLCVSPKILIWMIFSSKIYLLNEMVISILTEKYDEFTLNI